jgi:hypothetical protein
MRPLVRFRVGCVDRLFAEAVSITKVTESQ